jgi:hypothetical protein
MKTLCPLLIALGLIAAPTLHAQTRPAAAPAAAPASAASAPVNPVRAEVATGLNAAIELHRAGKVAEALALVDQTIAAVPQPSTMERALMQRTRGLMALQLEQYAPAAAALEAALATDALPVAERLPLLEALSRAHFQTKNYAAALDWARKASAAGSTWPGLAPLVTRAMYLNNDFAGVVRDLEPRLSGGPPLPEEDLRILASAYGKLNDDVAYTRIVERLLRDHQRREYWPDLLARTPRQPGWQQRYDIDLYRLRMHLDAMDDADDYLVLADLAARAGFPAEAASVLEAGYAKGLLGKGPGAAEAQKLRATVNKQANDDRANLTAAAGRTPTVSDARSATTALTTGAALVSIGQADRGLVYMKAALAGPLPDPAQARLQYAVALQRAGRTAEAVEALREVGSHQSLGLLARLWTIALASPPKKA